MRKYNLAFFISIFLLLIIAKSAFGGVRKYIKVGKFQDFVVDFGDQGEGTTEGACGGMGWSYYDDFLFSMYLHRTYHLGVRNWVDTVGNVIPHKIAGCGSGTSDELALTMPVPDEEGITIHRYFRDPPPTILVEGYHMEDAFPFLGDEVAPDKIQGTADVMVESWIRTSIGITIHQRVYAWSQTNHDDYLIYDWTFKNTGNIDLDEEIELLNQTLDSVYFFRGVNSRALQGIESWHQWRSHPHWDGYYGQHPTDILRMQYSYSAWLNGEDWMFGWPEFETSRLRSPLWIGEAILHVDSTDADERPIPGVDNPAQPHMTGILSAERAWFKWDHNQLGPEEHQIIYNVMKEGLRSTDEFEGIPYLQDIGEDVYPGTHHVIPHEMRGAKYPDEFEWWSWQPMSIYSCGPFHMEPGDSFRIVRATVAGTISPTKGREVGRAWFNGECTFDGPINLPPPADSNPELVPTANDSAKDMWVTVGKDSLFKNANNAIWNLEHNYDVPIPPPAPSIEVTSRPNEIIIEWGNESESASDLAGYKVYRAIGKQDSTYTKIFECGPDVHLYADIDDAESPITRGVAYYYYVAAFDDGSNAPGVNGTSEVLESGKYLNRTTRAAHLTREAGGLLSDIRVVPNPYSAAAEPLQYPGEEGKIMFLNLPPVCRIEIYNESLDLIKTLEHTDGSGDEPWADPTGQEFMVTSSHQNPVSGLYIAHIETPDGRSTNVKFVIIR